MLTRRQALPMLAAPVLAAAPAKRPNIVFILVDDLRWDALGYAGHPFAQTPNIDRLAQEGARFTNAFVTTPLCSPSRASFLTGQYVHKHGVEGNGDNAALSHRLITFPKLLHDAGYETGYFGKWHMGNDDSPRPGFDRWVSFRGQGVYNDPEFNIDGNRQQQEGYMTDLLSRYAVDFIRAPHTKPFCVYLAHKAVHGPFTPAARYTADFSDREIPRAPSAKVEPEGKPALTRPLPVDPARKAGAKKNAGPVGPSDELVRNQLRCLRSIDDGVGGILKALADTGKLKETVVIFTSDNGYFWGEHKLGDKRWAYDESIRIPMVISHSGSIAEGLRVGEMALNIDIAPTVLALAGLKPPKSMHGRSLMPLFGKGEARWRNSFAAEYFAEPNFPRAPSWHCLRTAEWKYVRYPDLTASDELYHLRSDRYELKNLIDEPRVAKVLKELRRELDRQRKVTA
jgi:N-acetylglucosamine-6-sulfatase